MDLIFCTLHQTVRTLLNHLWRRWLRRQALHWLLRLKTGKVTVADARAFRAWGARSAAHRQVWAEVATLWQLIGEAARLYALQPSGRPVRARTLSTFSSSFVASGRVNAPRWLPVRPKH